MYSPVHATAGFFIAAATPNPWIGIPLAIASHYMLDAVPHGDNNFSQWMTGRHQRILAVESIDLGTAAMMVALLIATHPGFPIWYLIAGAIGGILPDLLWGTRFLIDRFIGPIPWLTKFLHGHDRFHSWGHAKAADDIPYRAGLIYQGILLALVLLFQL